MKFQPESWIGIVNDMYEWFSAEGDEDPLLSMILAALSHHGRPVSERDFAGSSDRAMWRWWMPQKGVDPMDGIEDLANKARQYFPCAFENRFPPLNVPPAFQHRFAGLVMLADWIASDVRFFPYRADPGEDRLHFARDAAKRALSSIGLIPLRRQVPISFRDVFDFDPTPLQFCLAGEIRVEEQSRLILMESDTGSGKTEAALAWFFRLYAEEKVDGLYFALPTRVAARELYGRILRAFEKNFPGPENRPKPVLLAVPGYVRIDGELLALPDPRRTLWEDEPDHICREHAWAAEHPKRFMAAPIAVGTIDQALLSALMVKHSLLRSVCLDRHLLVVDEVHASDLYMRMVLQSLLQAHLCRGGWALLLSATLGESACAEFFKRPSRPLSEAQERTYPAVVTLDDEIPISARGRKKTVRIEWIEGLDEESVLPLIHRALLEGARVFVICNTVGRANAMLRAVEASGFIPPAWVFSVNGLCCPHHGRFARNDREIMDATVTERFGKNSNKGPLLLIGTQTLEQSLDIDADWLITDPCPMDVLLQRLGRLQRHERPYRPRNYATPRVLIRGPKGFDIGVYLDEKGRLRGPAGIGSVYADGRILQKTLDVLRACSEIVLPDDNRSLVENATHPDALKDLGMAWSKHRDELEGKQLMELRLALTSTAQEHPFGELRYPGSDERIFTRLGTHGIEICLDPPPISPFGNTIKRIAIPEHMLPLKNSVRWPESVSPEVNSSGFDFSLGSRRYRYTRFGFEIENE